MNDDHVIAGAPARADDAPPSAGPLPSNGSPESAPGIEPVPLSGQTAETFAAPQISALSENAQGVIEPATEPPPDVYHGPPPRGFIAEWVVTIILLLFGTTNLVQAFVIPTGSMEDTLKIGDHLLVDKLAYSPANRIEKTVLPYEDVKRGDIIVFRYPMDISQTFVKRCIGVPGDRIHLVSKQLWLNGRPVNEPYVFHKSEFFDEYRDNFPSGPAPFHIEPGGLRMLAQNLVKGEIVVPAGSYFAMGDNRDESSDSRYWGFVPRGNIIGKPLMIYWSYDAPTRELAGPFAIDHLLDMVLHFPTKTRWSRTFQFIHGYPLN